MVGWVSEHAFFNTKHIFDICLHINKAIEVSFGQIRTEFLTFTHLW